MSIFSKDHVYDNQNLLTRQVYLARLRLTPANRFFGVQRLERGRDVAASINSAIK